MKKGINLLKRQKKYQLFQRVFSRLKIIIILEVVIFLFIYSIFYYLLLRQKQKIDLLSAQKKDMLEFFIQNKTIDAKFIYFRGKQKQLSDILKQDINFFPYYNLLRESLLSHGPEAQLEYVLIDKSRGVSFTIGFEDYSNLLVFLKFAESDDFLKSFNHLVLSNFSNLELAKNAYKLTFSGKFNAINEN